MLKESSVLLCTLLAVTVTRASYEELKNYGIAQGRQFTSEGANIPLEAYGSYGLATVTSDDLDYDDDDLSPVDEGLSLKRSYRRGDNRLWGYSRRERLRLHGGQYGRRLQSRWSFGRRINPLYRNVGYKSLAYGCKGKGRCDYGRRGYRKWRNVRRGFGPSVYKYRGYGQRSYGRKGYRRYGHKAYIEDEYDI